MAYEVTANRKRPKTFSHMVGQEFVVATLTSSLETGRIAHAYLFSGPRGVGKTSAARILARALNCPDGPTGKDCGEYPGSEEISRGTSIDVIEIDGASNTSVNDIRAIKDEVLFPPQGSRYKIYIIDEVHMLSNSAFNALLKTIEEPPPYIIFIFATTEIHKVPATIRSRCQQFNFRLIPLEDIVRLLEEACGEMEITAEREALVWIAKEATGSLRDAYTLFDQIVSFSGQEITGEKIRRKLGILGLDRVNAFVQLLVDGDCGEALSSFDEMVASGISLEQFIDDLCGYFRALLLLKNGIRRENLLGFSAENFPHSIQDNLSPRQLERLIELLLQVYRNIRYSMNPRFDVEVWISKASAITKYLSLMEVVQEIQKLGLSAAPAAAGPQQHGSVRPATVHESPASGAARRGEGSTAAASPGSGVSGSAGAASAAFGGNSTAYFLESAEGHENPESAEIEPGTENLQRVKAVSEPAAPAVSFVGEITQSHIDSVLAAIRKENITLASSLEKAVKWDVGGSMITLRFESAMPAKMVSEQLKTVRAAVRQAIGSGATFDVSVAVEKPGTRPAANEEPIVAMAKDIFRGMEVDEGE